MLKPKRPLSSSASVAGFTLVELMVSSAASVFVLAGIISTFLFLSRSGVGLGQYNEMETQARATYQVFGEDCRTATDASWSDATTLVLTVDGDAIVYEFDASGGSFIRTANGNSQVIADEISAFSFKAFDINTNALDVASAPSTAGGPAKMIQVDLDLSRQEVTTVRSTQRLISARFVLRNKKVS
ncbi:PilW family protein [Actomonas aquatica]|uniref:Prepilin-type N-terminal cleavage/methylation domain-containing protein n=1 Tax=Actomonas aquatica TaxID=2866162 RepID=A0ABZ1C8A7_9BACT|nr:hypothetical protein [Opitutus sp. WL0086]WRQ86784.1 hypothetical protein K1X11_018385 [Opitutus sp. WL0086]